MASPVVEVVRVPFVVAPSDRGAWFVEVQSSHFDYSFSCKVDRLGRETSLDVHLHYHDAVIDVGRLRLEHLSRTRPLHLMWFVNHFRRSPVLMDWQKQFMPHVPIAGIMTSALLSAVLERVSIININLKFTVFAHNQNYRHGDQIAIERLYESMSFVHDDASEAGSGGSHMSTTVKDFIEACKPLVIGRPRLTLGTHKMETRTQLYE